MKKKFTWILQCSVELEVQASSMEDAIEKALDQFEKFGNRNCFAGCVMVDEAEPMREFKAV